ncbi:MAG TPA: MFS transporter [Gaiellaceae bacterium]|nr:MFS transporter [Gaiellaceae bacterium]
MGERVRIREILEDRGVRAIIALALLVMFGFGLVLPVLPLFARSFGVGYGAASVLVSAFAFTRLGADLVAGPLVDRYGERLIGAAGIALTAASSLATALAPTFPVAVALWAVGGAGSAVMFAAFYSYLLKAVPKERMARALGVFYGAFNGGMIAGGAVGGVVAHVAGLETPLVVYGCVLALAAVLFLRLIPDTPGRAAAPPLTTEEAERERDLPVARRGRTAIGRLFRTPGFAVVMVVNLAYLWMVAAVFNTLVPFFAKDELGMSTVAIGVVFAVMLAAEFAVLYPAGSAADRHGRKAVMVPALAGLVVMTALVGFAGAPVVLGLALALLGVASGYAGVPPAAMLADVTPEEGSGTAVGTFRFFGDLGLAFGPIVAGYSAAALGFEAAFALAAVPSLVALALVLRMRETLRPAVAPSA